MGVSAAELCERYPVLYHMAEVGAWPGIRRHGLLSVSAILDLCEVKGGRRHALEAERRPRAEVVEHPQHGSFVLRDQAPLSVAKLARCLQDGLTPEQWLRLLNGKVFLWADRSRAERLLGARLYRGRQHRLLSIDTAQLLARHVDQVRLTPMNTGSTSPMGHPRGVSSFLPLAEYPFEERRRSRKEPVVEVAVEYSIPDVVGMIVGNERIGPVVG